MEQDKKEKLKTLLATMGDDEDKQEVQRVDKLDRLEAQVEGVVDKLETSMEGLTSTLEKQRSLTLRASQSTVSAFSEATDVLAKKLDEVAGTISTSYEKNKPMNAAGVYKDMLNQLSAIDGSIKNKPVPVWNWPQYASVGVRNKSFTNVDPAIAYQNGTATEALPWGTLPAYDNAGTITTVSAANPLPVTASVSINSSALVGLQVNLTKATTSVLSGIRVYQQNSPPVTIQSSTLAGLQVNITKLTTSVFSGIRVYQQNSPSVTIQSTTLAGLQVDTRRLGGVAISLNTGTRDAGTQRVTIATDDSVPVTGTFWQATQPVSATNLDIRDLLFASDKVDVSGSSSVGVTGTFWQATQPVSIATTALAGVQVDITRSITLPVSGTFWQATQPVSIITSTLAGVRVFVENPATGTQNVNITAATTSVLSGVKVVLNGSTSTIPVSLSGNQAINIAAATTSVLAGTRVFVENPTSGSNSAASATGSAVPADAGYTGINVGGTLTGVTGTGTAMDVHIKSATTSVLAGVKVDIERSITIPVSGTFFQATQPVSIVTSTLAGVRTFIQNFPSTQNVSITGATTSVLSGINVVLDGSNSTIPVSLSGNQAVNIAAASTSVLAGLQVKLQNTSTAIVTTSVVGIATSASGDTKLISAPGAGKRIYIYAWNLSFNGTVNAKFTDGLSSRVLAGLIYGVANAGGGNAVSPNFLMTTPQPDLFHTNANSSLYINLSGAVAVGGSISYYVI